MSQETFREIINRVARRVEGILPVQIKPWVNERLEAIAGAFDWSWLNKEGVFSTVVEYSTGTVAVTAGSTSVVGTGTSWTSGMVGRIFRVGSNADYYIVSAVGSATALTLDANYEGDTETGKSYKINTNRYSLATDVDSIEEIRLVGGPRPLQKVSLEWLDSSYPHRPYYGDPQWWAFVRATGGTEEIELYPVPDTEKVVRYLYKKEISNLDTDTDTIPEELPVDTLTWGVCADAYGFLGQFDRMLVAERRYADGIKEMMSADARETRMGRAVLAPQYVAHRRRRQFGKLLDNWTPWNEDGGY